MDAPHDAQDPGASAPRADAMPEVPGIDVVEGELMPRGPATPSAAPPVAGP